MSPAHRAPPRHACPDSHLPGSGRGTPGLNPGASAALTWLAPLRNVFSNYPPGSTVASSQRPSMETWSEEAAAQHFAKPVKTSLTGLPSLSPPPLPCGPQPGGQHRGQLPAAPRRLPPDLRVPRAACPATRSHRVCGRWLGLSLPGQRAQPWRRWAQARGGFLPCRSPRPRPGGSPE